MKNVSFYSSFFKISHRIERNVSESKITNFKKVDRVPEEIDMYGAPDCSILIMKIFSYITFNYLLY